jgi:hypothetical protein
LLVLGAALACALPAGLAGCREELGPVALRTTRVTGTIREGGRPVGRGWVEFVPIEGTVGNLRTAAIGPDGRFEATRVAVGRNLIGLVNVPMSLPDGPRLFAPSASPIRRAIPAGDPAVLEIDLLEEAIRHQRQQATTAELPETSR